MKKLYLRKGLEKIVIGLEIGLIIFLALAIDSLSIKQMLISGLLLLINTPIVINHTHLTDEN